MTQIPKKCTQCKSDMSANVFLFSFFLAFTGNILWYTSFRTVLFLCGTDSTSCWAHVLDLIDEMMMINDEIILLHMTSFFRKLSYTFLAFCFDFSNQISFWLYLLFVSFVVLNLAYKQCRSKSGFFKSTRNTRRREILNLKQLHYYVTQMCRKFLLEV